MQFVNAGTAEADSVAYLTIVTAGTLSQIVWENTTNGDKLTISGSFVNGDQIIVDGENKVVTKNGSVIDYTGVLPKIIAGSNSFRITPHRIGIRHRCDRSPLLTLFLNMSYQNFTPSTVRHSCSTRSSFRRSRRNLHWFVIVRTRHTDMEHASGIQGNYHA